MRRDVQPVISTEKKHVKFTENYENRVVQQTKTRKPFKSISKQAVIRRSIIFCHVLELIGLIAWSIHCSRGIDVIEIDELEVLIYVYTGYAAPSRCVARALANR